MTNETNKMKLWPGPLVMVPIATDVLLVGNLDIPQPGQPYTGTALVSNKLNYWDLFMKNTPGVLSENIFNIVSDQDHLQSGAHIMWTLPYALRKGKQSDGIDNNGDIAFPLVPNRWLITRFEYTDVKSGAAPNIVSNIIKSDVITPGQVPGAPEVSQYPQSMNGLPVNTIGESVKLDDWAGDIPDPASTIDLRASGPASLSWSVTYDNVREVFGFYDSKLSEDASLTNSVFYTYSIVGWYLDPEKDVLIDLPTTNNEWQSQIQNEFMWTVGENAQDVDNAILAWTQWQAAHGLSGTFDPSKLDLPPQAKAAIEAWYAWDQANGVSEAQPDLPTQMLCHSMIGMIEWKGKDTAYGSGNPLSEREYPTIAVGNNSVEAIATYMAHEIVNNPGKPQPQEDIPLIARSLEAYQKDLLADYQTDPVNVENLLLNNQFSYTTGGVEWVVVRSDSDTDNPSKGAGNQTIPLDQAQTDALTSLNGLQRAQNALNGTITSQRNELFILNYKLYVISIQKVSPIPADIVKKVKDSFAALKSALTSNLTLQQDQQTTIAANATALEGLLGSDYILKPTELDGVAIPNDPVIMVAGAKLDTKLSTTSVNMDNLPLDVRVTGQFVTQFDVTYTVGNNTQTVSITPDDLLGYVTFPAWNAFPKEVMDLWTETLFLDCNAAAAIAVIYFKKINILADQYNAKTLKDNTVSPLQDLTQQIQTKQTLIYNDSDALEIPKQTLVQAAGFTGIPPAHAAIAFRTKQPWTPVFMDWKVKWFPNSLDSTDPFSGWQLKELDYSWTGTNIPGDNALTFSGRSVLNPSIAQNIQLKLSTFTNDPSYGELPQFMKDDLAYAAARIKDLDILTQSIGGFTEQLITKDVSATAPYGSNSDPNGVDPLLLNQNESFVPVLGTTSCPDNQTYSPIRSGHFQVIDVWIIDAFGQIMFSKTLTPGKTDDEPMKTIQWSESLTTPDNTVQGATLPEYGQLPPRLSQAAQANLDLLDSSNDAIISNSADSTSPICGWIMANHLDNSLMVYDEYGNNYGAVIKVQTESQDSGWSIRWDAAPGMDTALGAPPNLPNEHLQNFVTGLLQTGFQGAGAYSDFMAAIDSALWTLSGMANKNGNTSLLLGRPIAVVRAQVEINISGTPVYKQNWCDTGKYYNDNGVYSPANPPYMDIPFSLRIGDAYTVENGVMGYFEADNYSKFCPVYGVDGATQTYINIIRAGQSLNFEPVPGGGYSSDYIEAGHTIAVKPSGDPVKVTILVDPVGNIPIFTGAFPFSAKVLPNGPVSTALSNLKASFRAGPLLLDPHKIKMPTPAEVRGNWSWLARETVSSWNAEAPVGPYTSLATLGTEPLSLIEGWLTLSGNNEENK